MNLLPSLKRSAWILASIAAAWLAVSHGPAHGAVVSAAFDSATTVPVTAANYSATGNSVELTLNFTPPTGTNLTVVRSTGLGFITGRFSNLAQGQVVTLSHKGATFRFAANYHGGTGNDLVLHWAEPKPYGWGNNAQGQLGTGNTSLVRSPTALLNSGVLVGKTLVSVSAGSGFSLALCADGTVAAWGRNNSGQLGNNTTNDSSVAVDITNSGVLAGKTVVAVAAGNEHSVALCTDGTVAAWGANGNGQLGNGTRTSSNVPVAVTRSGVLAGRTVVAIAAGGYFSLALCADGKPVAWGTGGNGQLGNSTLGSESNVPVNVTTTGALAGKLVAAISTGHAHALALCTDGTLVAWGSNNRKECGGASGTDIQAPVLISPSGALAGKAVTAIAAGNEHNLALCADGTVAAWGYGGYGALGGGGYLDNPTPTAVTTTGVLTGKTVTAIAAGYTHSAALCSDGTLAAWGDNRFQQFGDQSNTEFNNVPVAVLTSPLGQAKAVTLASGQAAYHTVALAAAPVLSSDSALSGLVVNSGNLSPTFRSATTQYSVCVPNATTTLTVTPTASSAAASITVNGSAVASGTASPALALNLGTNPVQVVVTASDGSSTTYSISVLRPDSLAANFSAAGVVPVRFPGYDATGLNVSLALGFAPTTGTNLTVVDNSGLGFIRGRFSNLAQGAPVTLAFGTFSYSFVADYFGGTGNDLVLRWANRKLYAAGSNATGQLGNNTMSDSNQLVAVTGTGALAGKTVTAVAAGQSHTLALCADGTVVAWGDNSSGQLGNAGAATDTPSKLPVAVTASGALAGKSVAAIAAGGKTSYALCADGTVVSWGDNQYGQLGNGSSGFGVYSKVPVSVVSNGVLAGRPVVAIAAGSSFCLALCADDKMAAWGLNYSGALGNGGNADSSVPVAVNASGTLAGKSVSAISAGSNFALVLCADGTMASWGANGVGQLGDGSTTNSALPTPVNGSPALTGRTVTAISTGREHCHALCSDGGLVAWGANDFGVYGDNSSTASRVPVAVPAFGALAGRTITSIKAGNRHSLAVCADGSLATWGANSYGQLANGQNIASSVPVAVSTATLGTGERFTAVAPGPDANHTMAVVALPNVSGLSGLTALSLSMGTLSPAFSPNTATYTANVPNATRSITVTPTALNADVRLTLNGEPATTGVASAPIPLAEGANTITLVATSPDGTTVKTHTLVVTRGITLNAPLASATSVPVTATDYTASSSVINLTLGYAPATGATLMVINNTGAAFIAGQFTNLAQSQVVSLTYNHVTYKFMANYFGGTGNDLVLQWANDRIYTWGSNFRGQLGNNSFTNSSVPIAITGGPLAGKVITRVAAGVGHCIALCADGSMAAWGDNSSGQLGNGNTTDSSVPVAVRTDGVLAGKTVISIAAGGHHSLALCSDGTLAAWGDNGSGQLGDGGFPYSRNPLPVAVATNGALAGKTVTAIAVASAHNLALCSDGTLAAWGTGNHGQLGNGGIVDRNTPYQVTTSGVLAGKTVSAIATGVASSMALCTDGTLAAWGYNLYGQLGNNSTTDSTVPVAIHGFGALAGKTVVAIAAGGYHGMALRSDRVLVTWGYNDFGQLGINSTTDSRIPVSVTASGVLAGRSIRMLSGGTSHCLVHCTDGTLAAWGRNLEGQLGNNTFTNSSVPVAAATTGLAPGEKVMSLAPAPDGYHTIAMVAVPLPTATGVAATAITGTGAALRGSVNGNGNAVTVAFEYGLDTTYGSSISASPASVSGNTATAVGATLAGLKPGTTYHYRVVASASGGTVRSADMVFTTLSDNPRLARLKLGSAALVPEFAKETTDYLATVPFGTASVTTIPVTDHPGASVTINGSTVASGAASAAIDLPIGNSTITTVVTAQDGLATKTYRVTVTRLPQAFVFHSATDVPVSANGFATGGHSVTLTINHAPLPGTMLTLVNNTGLGFIEGRFANLTHGQRVTLAHGGKTYDFTVNYFGGTGNDLVLHWADTTLVAWGNNAGGQIGDDTTTRRPAPTPVNASGVLADKTITAVAGGYLHSLALCSDGTLAAWGYNLQGQLGDGGEDPSLVPSRVKSSGALAGKTVVALAAGAFHSLALCDDGTVLAWGYNNHGQLGDGTRVTRREPVLVSTGGALAGKRAVAIAAGAYHSFARCDDGTVAAWGYSDEGELGDGATATRLLPVRVADSGALAGKRVASLAAGQYHTLALCTDGTLVSWGYNHRGQLGDNSTTNRSQPVAIGSFGALAGKTPVGVSAGAYHSLARCADGTIAAWGANPFGQLAVAGTTPSSVPVATGMPAATHIAAGASHSIAHGTDGTLQAWGDNSEGQLGDHSVVKRATPAAVDFAAMANGFRVMAVASGSAARHSLALVALEEPTGKTVRQVSGGAVPSAESDLLQLAFGSNAGPFPQPKRIGDAFVIRFTEPDGTTGIRYGAEWSETLLPGSWTELPDTGIGNEHRFSIPAVVRPRVFMRLKVTTEEG